MKQIILFPKISAALILAGLVTLSSCKKDNNSTATSDSAQVTEAVQSDAVAEDQFNEVFNITMGAAGIRRRRRRWNRKWRRSYLQTGRSRRNFVT